MKHLYDSLRGCAKEEEVKAEFCKFFKMKIFALRGIDHYTERVLFEFKYDRYDWDRVPSTPCPLLEGDMLAAFLKQTELLTPNGVRELGGSQFTATATDTDATSCVPPAVSGVSREQIRLLIYYLPSS